MAKLNKCTVMFLFAGDNALSPLIVSQIKAIKDAGYQEDTDVLIYFDGSEKGCPTRMYNVNQDRKSDPRRPRTDIGDGRDSYVRNMKDDLVRPSTIRGGEASRAIRDVLLGKVSMSAKDALKNFIGYCRESHQAQHYILFLVGHGLIVANDTFLPDDDPVSSISLEDFGDILNKFSAAVEKDGDMFDLLALHSCSMSALEVAYQLRDTANYMIAPEGLSYIGSWPYRQLLKNIFNDVDGATRPAREGARNAREAEVAARNAQVDIPTLMYNLFGLTLYSGTDYMLSGYSSDLCLCDLTKSKLEAVKTPLKALVAALMKGLKDRRGNELILLAHLRSQSYWGEEYTDLIDFCECLSSTCEVRRPVEKDIKSACEAMITALTQPDAAAKRIILRSDQFGSKYQYSRGLSIYFPWSEPVAGDVGSPNALKAYAGYQLNKDLGKNSWFEFLKLYFEGTKRLARPGSRDKADGIDAAILPYIFSTTGSLAKPTPSVGPGDGKPTPSTGSDCGCPTIKNFATRTMIVNGQRVKVRFSISETPFEAIE